MLRNLAELTDEIGVLSVYVTRDPHSRAEAGARTPWELRMRHELDEIRKRVKQEQPREHGKALASRLAELAPQFDRLLDPTSSGRGGALFAGITGGEPTTIAVQVPLGDRVVLEPGAYLRPLVTAWSMAGPAGAVSVSADELKIYDLRFGQAEVVGSIPCLYEADPRRELKGPAAANPALAQHSASQHDLFERREDDRLLRFLRTVGPQLAEHVTGRHWRYLALTGEAQLVQAVQSGLPPQLPAQVVTLDHPVNSLSAPKLAATVAPALERARRERHRGLAEQARNNAMSANTGACGLGETLGALQEGRVAHLLLAEDGDWAGSATPAGYLVPDGEVPPGADAGSLRSDPHLGERMIELAYREGGEVTVLEPDEAAPLADAGGIGAILRW
jgi:hypothetical protein